MLTDGQTPLPWDPFSPLKRLGRDLGDLDAVISGLAYPGWSDGASVNLVDTVGRAMANVEVYQDPRGVGWSAPAKHMGTVAP